MNDIEKNLRIYQENLKEQKRLQKEEAEAKRIKAQNEESQKQKVRDERDRAMKEKYEREEEKLIRYAETIRPSEKIFEYYKNEIISGDLQQQLLAGIQKTNEANNIVLFADNGWLEAFFKAVDFGGQGSYTDQLRCGLELNTIFGNDFLKKSTIEHNKKLWYTYQIGHDVSEFARAKRCLVYCLERHGPFEYAVENGPFKDYVLYGKRRGLLASTYVYGLRKETLAVKFFRFFSRG